MPFRSLVDRVSMRARITVAVLALMAVVVAVLAIVTSITLRAYLVSTVDEDLAGSTQRAVHAVDGPYSPRPGDAVALPGQAPGTLAAFVADSRLLVAGVLEPSGSAVELTDAQRTALAAGIDGQPIGEPFSATVADLGDYRLIGVSLADGGVLIMGLSLGEVDGVVAQYWWLAAAVAGGVLLVSGVGAWLLGSALQRSVAGMRTALRKSEASESRLRRFVGDASHELRTPLAAIRGYAELTRRSGARLRGDVAHALDRIESESIRMTSLVEDLLMLARLDGADDADAGGRVLELAPVDLAELVRTTVGDIRVLAPDHDWTVVEPAGPIVVEGDAARLHQAVVNLLANAAAHTPAGTSVVARVVEDGGSAVVEVVDDGPGIPPELAAQVFGRFVRGDASRSRAAGSTGLGLAIVEAVAQAHGGSASVESAPGRTAFRVLLPISSP